jgi:hypothetical protein
MNDAEVPDEVVVVVVVVDIGGGGGRELDVEVRDVYKKIDDASVSGGLTVISGCGDNGRNASKVRKMDVLSSFTIVNRAKNAKMFCDVMKRNRFRCERNLVLCSCFCTKISTQHNTTQLNSTKTYIIFCRKHFRHSINIIGKIKRFKTIALMKEINNCTTCPMPSITK